MRVEQLIAWLQRGTAWHIPLISSEVASPWTLLSSLLSPNFPSCGGAVCLSDSYLPPDSTHTLKLPYKRLNFSSKKESSRRLLDVYSWAWAPTWVATGWQGLSSTCVMFWNRLFGYLPQTSPLKMEGPLWIVGLRSQWPLTPRWESASKS